MDILDELLGPPKSDAAPSTTVPAAQPPPQAAARSGDLLDELLGPKQDAQPAPTPQPQQSGDLLDQLLGPKQPEQGTPINADEAARQARGEPYRGMNDDQIAAMNPLPPVVRKNFWGQEMTPEEVKASDEMLAKPQLEQLPAPIGVPIKVATQVGGSILSLGGRALSILTGSTDLKNGTDQLNDMMSKINSDSAAENEKNGIAGAIQGGVERTLTGVGQSISTGPVGMVADMMNKAATTADEEGLTGKDKLTYVAGEGAIGAIQAYLFHNLGGGGGSTTKEALIAALKQMPAQYAGNRAVQIASALLNHAEKLDDGKPVDLSLFNKEAVIDTVLQMGVGHVSEKVADLLSKPKTEPESTLPNNGLPDHETFVKENPEAAEKLAAIDKPSRKDMLDAGVTDKMNAEQRVKFADRVRTELLRDESAPETPGAKPAQTPESTGSLDVKQALTEKMGHEPRTVAFNPDYIEGSEAPKMAIEVVKDHLKSNPDADAVWVGIDIKNQKGTNTAFGGDNSAADTKALGPWSKILHEELAKIPGVDATMFKQGGDEWGGLITSDGKIDPEQVQAAVDRAKERQQGHAKDLGIHETENPRAPSQERLGYDRNEMSTKNQKVFDKLQGEYLNGRGTGFRVGVTDVLANDTFESINSRVAEQHEAEKAREHVVGTTASDAGTIPSGEQSSSTARGVAEASGRTAKATNAEGKAAVGSPAQGTEESARSENPAGEARPGSAANPNDGKPAESVGTSQPAVEGSAEKRPDVTPQSSDTSSPDFKAAVDKLREKLPDGQKPESGQAAGMMLPLPISGADISHVAKIFSESAKFIHSTFAPASVNAESAATAGNIREHAAEFAHENEKAVEATKAIKAAFEKFPIANRLDFMDRMEKGQKQATPELTNASRTLRQMLDRSRTAVQNLGTGKLSSFIENYFPHIWKDTQQAKNVVAGILGKRPLEGPASFLKQRTIPTITEGIKAGLEPVSTNPVDLVLLKVREEQRYIMAHKIMNEMKEQGLATFVKSTEKPPDGMVKINDKIATEYGPPTIKGAIQIRGNYYAPEAAARIINNYLSPGLRGNAVYDSFQGLGNIMNQAQLGLSAFHLGFTSADSANSKVALGVKQFVEGSPLKAAANIARSPIAPIENYLRGSKVLSEYLRPGSVGGETATIVDALIKGGGRAKMDSFYKNSAVESFWKALEEGRRGGALIQAVPALLETSMKPIMEHLVPRMKLGIFADIAKYEMSKLPPGADTATVREVMGKAWDSVDNRMGQLVYDNLFWNKAMKDAAMASVRSVGWNIGTVRELGGGLADLVKMSKDVATGKKPEFTNRSAYLVALPFTAAIAGGMAHYLMTGRRPDDLKDYFYPSTGRKGPDGNEERVQLPTYMKDVFGYAKHPGDTVVSKLHPIIGTMVEMFNNKDFYGREIRNPDDPLVTQMQQVAEHLGKAFVPFAVRNVQESQKRDQPLDRQIPGFFGVTPAPRDEVRTPAQNKAIELIQKKLPRGPQTPEEAETQAIRQQIVQAIQQGKSPQEAMKAATDTGKVTDKEALNSAKKAGLDPRATLIKGLTIEQAHQVMGLANDEEKKLWQPVMNDKIVTEAKHLATPWPLVGDKNKKLSEKQAEWRANIKDAVDKLKAVDADPQQVKTLYWKNLVATVKTEARREVDYNRFMAQWRKAFGTRSSSQAGVP